MMNPWLYATLCVVVPVLWGVLVVALSNTLERFIAPPPDEHDQREPRKSSLPPVDYHI
jgi:hypothetical protein